MDKNRIQNGLRNYLKLFRQEIHTLASLTMFKKGINTENIEDLISVLRNVPGQLKAIDNLKISTVETDKRLLKELFKEPEEPIVTKFFSSEKLKASYTTRGLWFYLEDPKSFL